MDWIASPDAWLALLTLTLLELVLGIDNIVFISILAGKLPKEKQQRARQVGLLIALGTRVALLLSLSWILRLSTDLFTVFDHGISGRDLILLAGGLFLLAKATREIHLKLEGDEAVSSRDISASFNAVVVQIGLLDIVFSLDSVITAVGMADHLGVMIAAIVIAMAFMLLFARPLGEFVESHPTVKMLALSFLLLIGMTLVAEGFDFHIPKGYIYFAMGFSIFVEFLNLRLATKRRAIALRAPYAVEGDGEAGPVRAGDDGS